MRIGIMAGTNPRVDGTLEKLIARAKDVEARGFHSLWLAQIFGLDAIAAQGIVGRETSTLELGTAVVPTPPRHPSVMAQQALTSQIASGGRFVLGIGLSHKILIESLMGLSYDKPARQMREYMEVLGPLLRGEAANVDGEFYHFNAKLDFEAVEAPQVVIAALGDLMLKNAGRTADGTITWMTGPQTLESHIVPKISAAAREAGRPAPRIVAGMPICLTRDVDSAKQRIDQSLAMYKTLPSYRSMLDKEGAEGPSDIALVGDEKALDAGLQRLREAGVTDLDAAILGFDADADTRALDYLQSRL